MYPSLSQPTRDRLRNLLLRFWAATALLFLLMIVAGLYLDDEAAALIQGGGVWTTLMLAALLSFVAEYVDSSLGMGYGTTLTPMLLLLGFEPLQVVPAVLVQELVSGTIASVGHHWWGNVDLRPGRPAFGIALMLGLCGLIGGAVAARTAVEVPKEMMRLITGGVVITMGVLSSLAALGRLRFTFTWPRAAALGLVAAINKGFMGGGYGPIVTSGQIVTGSATRSAVAVTSASEMLTCAGGLLGYALGNQGVDWRLALGLVIGGAVAALLASPTVRVLPARRLTATVAVGCFVLGAVTILTALRG